MDPLIGSAVAHTVASSAAGETGKLLGRVLGPSADVIGEALARFTEQRVKNVGRIAKKAEQKSRPGSEGGQVPPRVAYKLLEEGSFCDDELMAEYLGGVLAAGKTPSGRDDRAITWSNLVTSMSSFEVRAHFLLYEAWARSLHNTNLDLWTHRDLNRALIFVDAIDFINQMRLPIDGNPVQACNHALVGLERRGLIEDVALGGREHITYKDTPFDTSVVAKLSSSGIELFGWALGLAGMSPIDFVKCDAQFTGDSLPRLARVAFPRLTPQPSSQ